MEEFDKSYYKIKDVSELLGVPTSALRYWEKEFPECAPRRSSTNIRYYTPKDIETLRMINYLLKIKGLKIEAAKEQMRSNRKNISKRVDIIESLTETRNELEKLLLALQKRR
ncbi:MAG: MerR family transcriptional regulator [Bacteroides sp.]|nr:MerR family transcriptional regulator [Bacteroides sp.]